MAELQLTRHDRARLHAELARVFSSPPRVGAVLDDIGFPRNSRPTPGGRVEDDWRDVLDSLESGMLRDGYRTLLDLALQAYPFNATFRELATSYAPELVNGPSLTAESLEEATGERTGEKAEHDCNVAVGRDHCEDEAVRALADAGLDPEMLWSTAVVALYRVSSDDPSRVREVLERTAARWTVLAPGAPRYFLEQIVVQGPDGRSFRVRDVPAATTVGNIAAEVVEQYLSTEDSSRPVVTDAVADDGSGRRLLPTATLDEAGIRDGDSMRVGFQAVAGALNPLLRQDALYRARNQILAFAAAHPDVTVTYDEAPVPTVYELEFTQPSLGPPAQPGGEPVSIDHHVLQIELGPDYPLAAPAVFWLTDIFHPNVYPTYDCESARQRPNLRGLVCLGELTEAYQPGLDLGQLCQHLRDLAGFRNYSLVAGEESLDAEGRPSTRWRGNAFDVEAATWVVAHPERVVALGGHARQDIGASRAAASIFAGQMDPLSW